MTGVPSASSVGKDLPAGVEETACVPTVGILRKIYSYLSVKSEDPAVLILRVP